MHPRTRTSLSAIWLVFAFFAATLVFAEEEASEYGEEPVFTPPRLVGTQATSARLLEPVKPVYPLFQRMSEQEGWVLLSMVIRPDGTVGDVVVQDSSGIEAFERSALKAAASQRFSPATIDGKPVEQCSQQVRYVFAIKDGAKGVRRSFWRSIRTIQTQIKSGELEAASAALQTLQEKGTWTLYEVGTLQLTRYEICRMQNDVSCQLSSLRQVTTGGKNTYLDTKAYRQVLITEGTLQIQERQYANALATISKLNGLKPPLEPDHPLLTAGEQIQKAIDGSANLSTSGMIGYPSGVKTGEPNWHHQLLRRYFTIQNVSGRLNKVDIRCDWRHRIFEYSPEHAWQIPESWGDCHVIVFGEEGTSFDLIEYPPEESQAAAGSGTVNGSAVSGAAEADSI